jgi:hypothetical protein
MIHVIPRIEGLFVSSSSVFFFTFIFVIFFFLFSNGVFFIDIVDAET